MELGTFTYKPKKINGANAMGMLFIGVILVLGGVGVILTGSIGGKMPGVLFDVGDAKYTIGSISILAGIYIIVQCIRDWISKKESETDPD